ncbi:MAG: hypothetical protein R6V67_02825, partial [Spirochaetia bacterium]
MIKMIPQGLSLLSRFILPLFIIFACSAEPSGESPSRQSSDSLPSLEVAAAAPGVYAPYLDVPGTVVTSEEITVSSPLSSVVEGFPVRRGSYVDRGAVLAVLDTEELKRELLRLQSRLEVKKQELKSREHALEEAVEEAERRWNSARRTALRLRRAKKNLKDALSAAEDSAELYEAGGIPRSTLRESEKRVEQAEHEVKRIGLLLEEAVIGFDIPENSLPDPMGTEEASNQTSSRYSEVFTKEKKTGFIEKTAQKNTSFIRIAEAEIEEVKEAIFSIEEKIEEGVIHSPISGVIESAYVHKGEFTESGRSMFSLYDPDTLLIEATLGE